jgi:predicted dehydrogenase
MSLNLPDARRIVDAARQSGKTCMVTHTRRFSSPHREIRRRIQDGTFHLQHMIVETYFFRRENTNMHGQPRSWVDNLLWHHGCHSVDLAQWILDEPNFTAWGQTGPDHPTLGVPMDLTVAMKSQKGPLFTMAMSFNNKGPFGGFYRYIGEEETYKVYRDSMTGSDGQKCRSTAPPHSIGRTSSSRAPSARAARRSRARRAVADDGAARPDRQGDAAMIIAMATTPPRRKRCRCIAMRRSPSSNAFSPGSPRTASSRLPTTIR